MTNFKIARTIVALGTIAESICGIVVFSNLSDFLKKVYYSDPVKLFSVFGAISWIAICIVVCILVLTFISHMENMEILTAANKPVTNSNTESLPSGSAVTQSNHSTSDSTTQTTPQIQQPSTTWTCSYCYCRNSLLSDTCKRCGNYK